MNREGASDTKEDREEKEEDAVLPSRYSRLRGLIIPRNCKIESTVNSQQSTVNSQQSSPRVQPDMISSRILRINLHVVVTQIAPPSLSKTRAISNTNLN